MTTLRSKKDIEAIKELNEWIAQAKELDKKIEEFKTMLKEKYDIGTHKAGNIEITIEQLTRESVSKKAVIDVFGEGAYDKVKTVTEYKTIKLKQVG